MDKLGYTHYTDKPETPGIHNLALVPQSVADGWEGLCSCGQWQAFESFYVHDTKEALISTLRKRFDLHVSENPNG